MMVAARVVAEIPAKTSVYAGFWQRALAQIIDWLLVSIAVCGFSILMAAAVPRLGEFIEVRMPFDVLEVSKTLDREVSTSRVHSGERVETTAMVYEIRSPLTPTYTYREVTARRFAATGHLVSEATGTEMIDPATRLPVNMMSVSSFLVPLMLLFAALFESCRLQASPGKLALGLKVTDTHGRRQTFIRALMRNVAKVLSVVTFFIGFMMVGWTDRKQALHDIAASALVWNARP